MNYYNHYYQWCSMRISDRYLKNSFLNQLTTNKDQVAKLQRQISTNTTIEKPSDSPTGAARVVRLVKQLDQNEQYRTAINSALEFTNESATTLDLMKENGVKISTLLVEMKNPVNRFVYGNYKEQVRNVLDIFVELSNLKHEGRYLFGGTDSLKQPITKNSDGFIEINSDFLDGRQMVKIADNIDQQINISGDEIFKGFANFTGNLSTSETSITLNNKVEALDGKIYDGVATFTKTGPNSYSMTYTIKDGSTDIYTLNQNIQYDETTGKITNIDGTTPKSVMIDIPANNISFVFDTRHITFYERPTTLKLTDGGPDVFNSLLKIEKLIDNKEDIPSEYNKIFDKFTANIVDKTTKIGNIYNKLKDTLVVQDTMNVEITDLLSKTKDTDVAKAVVDLQYFDYILNLAYKSGSMLLPKSLMDFI